MLLPFFIENTLEFSDSCCQQIIEYAL